MIFCDNLEDNIETSESMVELLFRVNSIELARMTRLSLVDIMSDMHSSLPIDTLLDRYIRLARHQDNGLQT